MKITHILVPVDRSKCSEAAVDQAHHIATLFGATVTILHAWEPLYELGVFMGAATITTVDGKIPLTEHIAEEARRTLESHVARLGTSSVTLHQKLVQGPPKRAIQDALDSGNFDLVVMGTHGRRGLSHVMMGSIAEWVVRHAGAPVMTVRSPAAAEADPSTAPAP